MSSETSLKFARLLSAEEREFSRVFFKTREDIVDFIRVHRDNYPDRVGRLRTDTAAAQNHVYAKRNIQL